MPNHEKAAETVEAIDRLGGLLDRRPDLTHTSASPLRAAAMESA